MPEPVTVDTTGVSIPIGPDTSGGVGWAFAGEDLNANVVVLGVGAAIAEHRNTEVDVLVVVLAGSGTLTVDGVAHQLRRGVVAHLPKGTNRRVHAAGDGLRYLTVHRRRPGLTIAGGAPGRPGRPG